ncbi:hypothetical protein [Nocardia arthritidis]|uniref:Uncharacterized protein n=1 Tax=Nocardia arthritidis TaxID=228602 RepID=A0A6G9YLN4_9NOCA|nr:hypothetical protein [Nocardia arthritidis]QIS14050.1 hypothetical protein F5544_31040 [Nocardia arthritidis]
MTKVLRQSSATAFQFHDSLIPQLEAGTYEISVRQQVDGIDTGGFFDTPTARTLSVRAPQFTLAADAVHGAYPPPGAAGPFDQLLPHLTLARAPLPWERELGTGDKGVPWVAVLVFAAGELPGDPEAAGVTRSATVADLLTKSDSVVVPDIDPATVPADVRAQVCRSIDVPADVFTKVVPRLSELHWLAHVRKGEETQPSVQATRSGGRAGHLAAADPTDDPELHAVVVGNRFPSVGGGQYVAHLVSLEGFRAYVAGDTTPDKPLRMVSLYNWSFQSLPDGGAHFGTLVRGLAAPGVTDPANLSLRIPPAATTGPVRDRLSSGYVPLNYRVSSGEQTLSWYRGPLCPVPPQPLPGAVEHGTTADARLIYLPEQGVFDSSYAAAWTLGRTLALADSGFAPALMQWRRSVGRLTARLTDTRRGRAGRSRAWHTTDPHVALHPKAASRRFDHLVSGGLGARLTGALNAPRRVDGRAAAGVAAPDTRTPVGVLRAHLADPAVRTALRQATAAEAAPVRAWLGRLAMLYPVPFDHLVPHGRLLPSESLRFFYVDRAWQTALIDGALSIGVATSLDADLTTLLHDVLDDIPASMSGFLVRSQLVAAWPALRMTVTAGGGPTTALRADALAGDVLMFLFEGIIDELVLTEPPQGMHLGYEDGEIIQGRDLTGAPGTPLPGVTLSDVTKYFRSADTRVLDTGALVGALSETLSGHLPTDGITAAGLAIQLVKATQQITFRRS